MEFGIQFFPDVSPKERSAEQYWADALHLSALGEDLGFTSIRTVEHLGKISALLRFVRLSTISIRMVVIAQIRCCS